MLTTRTYSELIQLPTFLDRFKYLQLDGVVGETTFGYERYLNQKFYHSVEWLNFKRDIIVRDSGCDLAIEGRVIFTRPLIHHINPISPEDIKRGHKCLLDQENAILVSHKTHNAIHYGDERLLPQEFVERRINDTCPWR